MRNIWSMASVLVLAIALPTSAASSQTSRSVKIGTFNVGWLLDRSGFDRWRSACMAVGWDSDSLTPEQAKTLDGLPYCNVHNGLKYPIDEKCPRLTEAEAKQRPLVHDKGCRETKDLMEWSDYQEKVASLRSMFAKLDRQGVRLIGLQEVFNADAVRSVLPSGWEVRTSGDIEGAPIIPQHVGVAWKVGVHAPTNWGLEGDLVGKGERPLRPGLVFTDSIGGKPVQFLVVHLKSGCSSSKTAISSPVSEKEKKNCPWLEKQVPVLEKWVDARVDQDFIILGDFNRMLTFEKKTPAIAGVRSSPMIGQLFPELNDDNPTGSLLWLAEPPRETGADGRIKSAKICPNGHSFIDHVVLSNSLYKRVRMGNLQANAIANDDEKQFKKGKPFVAAPTDHCPHYVELTPR